MDTDANIDIERDATIDRKNLRLLKRRMLTAGFIRYRCFWVAPDAALQAPVHSEGREAECP